MYITLFILALFVAFPVVLCADVSVYTCMFQIRVQNLKRGMVVPLIR